MKSIPRLLFALSLLLAGPLAHAANISGTYVGVYSNAADLLQIVERSDGSVLGRFEQVILSPAGNRIKRTNATVTGAANADALVLTLQPAKFLSGTIPMSGTIRGGTVQLSGGAGGSSFEMVLKRSAESIYTQHVQQLTAQANATATADATQKALARTQKTIVDVTRWMHDYPKNAAAEHLQRLPKMPAFYAKKTQKMHALLLKEKSFPPGSYARSQIDYKIGAMDFQFNSFHFNLQSVESSLGYSHGSITPSQDRQAAITRASSYCGVARNSSAPICENFSSAYVSYQAMARHLEQGLTSAETAWHSEHAKQKAIEKRAKALSNSRR